MTNQELKKQYELIRPVDSRISRICANRRFIKN